MHYVVQGAHFFGNVVECVDVRSPSQQPLPQHQHNHEPKGRQELEHSLTKEEGKVAHLKGRQRRCCTVSKHAAHPSTLTAH